MMFIMYNIRSVLSLFIVDYGKKTRNNKLVIDNKTALITRSTHCTTVDVGQK